MARSLLAEGRPADVTRMLEPLLAEEHDGGEGAIHLRCLFVRACLLRCGDPERGEELLAEWRTIAARRGLSLRTRSEIALWLGWSVGFPEHGSPDAARALALLAEAEAGFDVLHDADGKMWAFMGRAVVSLVPGLVTEARYAIASAGPLVIASRDLQAHLWYEEIHTRVLVATGNLEEALASLEKHNSLASDPVDRRSIARGFALRALILARLGRGREEVIDEVNRAREMLAAFPHGERLGQGMVAAAERFAHDEMLTAPYSLPHLDVLLHGTVAEAVPLACPFVSPALRTICARLDAARETLLPVLFTGPYGTDFGPFVKRLAGAENTVLSIDCSGLSDVNLGARFAGFATGDAGSHLVLHEVGGLSAEDQTSLLAALRQSGTARVIATTTVDLGARVEGGAFDPMLFRLLTPITVRIPGLKDVAPDIPFIARETVSRLALDGGPASLTPEALDILVSYDWPGNARQLRNELERSLRSLAAEPHRVIDASNLRVHPDKPARDPGATPELQPSESLDDALNRYERSIIESVLHTEGGQVAAAAQALGLTRQGLYKKIKRLGIDAGRTDEEHSVARVAI
jgi:hypothetical protein